MIFCWHFCCCVKIKSWFFFFLAENTINSWGTRTETTAHGPWCSHAQQQLPLHRTVLRGALQRGQWMQIYLSALGSYFTDVVNKRVQNHDTSSLSANDDKYISKALIPQLTTYMRLKAQYMQEVSMIVQYSWWKTSQDKSGNTQSQSSQLAAPLWTDPGLKSGISVRELISTF